MIRQQPEGIIDVPNSDLFVYNNGCEYLQMVPRRKIAMNTLMSGMGVPCTGTLRASVLSDS